MKTKIVAYKNILCHVQNTLKNLHTSQDNFKAQTCTRYDITKDYNLQPTMCKK
jgi:hypothetical protein